MARLGKAFSDVNAFLFACLVEVLHQNQKVKSEIVSFKEQTVMLGFKYLWVNLIPVKEHHLYWTSIEIV